MKAQEHRVKVGKPRPRSREWDRRSRHLAEQTGLDACRILDVHEEQALLLEWGGLCPIDAEWLAWQKTEEIFSARERDADAA